MLMMEADVSEPSTSSAVRSGTSAATATTAASSSSSSADLPHPSHYYQLPAEKEARLRSIYKGLDVNNDGTVDIKDLTLALKDNPRIPETWLPRLWERLNRQSSGDETVDFADFVHYALEHEKHLAIVFSDLDKNKDGYIDVKEVQNYAQHLGVTISDRTASNIITRMKESGSPATIDLSEFQNYMLLCPSTETKDMIDFWRHNLAIDLGEDGVKLPEEFTKKELQSGAWWRHLLAGGTAGCMSRTCTAPLDRIKVYLQVHASHKNRMGMVSAVRYMMAEGGFRSFWRGNGINVAKIAPESAMKFMAYEQIKRLIKKNNANGELSIYERFLAGSSAGAISQTVIYPLEVLKTRLALRKTGDLDHGLRQFAIRMVRTEGLLAFYHGYWPNLLGIIPYAGIDLAVYETLKAKYLKHYGDGQDGGRGEPGVLALIACGAFSSSCGMMASYPLALVRTRLQARAISENPSQPGTTLGQFSHILRTEGVTGLYRGMVPNFVKVIPAVGISYVVYESVRRRLGATMT